MKSLGNAIARLVLWSTLATILFPIVWVMLTSFKPAEISQELPPVWDFTPTLKNYRDVLVGATYTSQAFGVLIVHSFVVTIASTLVGLAVAVPAAYSLARLRYSGKRAAANWILSTIMFPPIVSVIPVFIIASRLGNWLQRPTDPFHRCLAQAADERTHRRYLRPGRHPRDREAVAAGDARGVSRAAQCPLSPRNRITRSITNSRTMVISSSSIQIIIGRLKAA